jgi:TonB family protein
VNDTAVRWASCAILAWTRFYTAGLPVALRDARRDEIASDLWESRHDADRGAATASHLLWRLVSGVPQDVWWRWEQEDAMKRPNRIAALLGGLTVSAVVFGVWVMIGSPFSTRRLPPTPPPWAFRTAMADLPAPPPPGPPPPQAGVSAPAVTFTYGEASYSAVDGAGVPSRVRDVRPIHPPMAAWNGIGGTVVLDATIEETGRVTSARIRSSAARLLEQPAIDAVQQWVFAPPVRDGATHPIDIRVTIVYPISR